LGNLLCGLSRPGHFKGVATVVGKFFNIIQPDVAYFGQKDAQQAAVIRKFTRDLNYPVKIKVMPIVRESDGLAMSSRNTYLSLEERSDAVIIYKALQKAKKLIELGNHNPTIIKRFIVDTIKEKGKIDYVEIVNQDTLERVKKIKGKILIAVAVRIGKVRLIDNLVIKA
jgi:pantoate--beta-alanine ligase